MFTNMKTSKGSIEIKHLKEFKYKIQEISSLFDVEQNAFNLNKGDRRFVIIDSVIDQLYGHTIRKYFQGFECQTFFEVIDSGENNKSLSSFLKIFSDLDRFDVDRRKEPIISIGGGVITDLGGFVASCYRRGVPHIAVPTTLMGFVDASIGIKTGINFNNHKNRMGSFMPPQAVLLDETFLSTLPTRHIINGFGEVFKIALIKDKPLFELLEQNGYNIVDDITLPITKTILHSSIVDMLEELEPNLFEDNLDRCVDFGHTFSPIIEMQDCENILHGEAVALDCFLSSCIAFSRNIISECELKRISSLYFHLKFPQILTCNKDFLWESVLERKKHRGGLQRIPFPTEIGRYAFINDLTKCDIENGIEIMCKLLTKKK
jgi:hypothetical protein